MRTRAATITKVAELKQVIKDFCEYDDDTEWIWDDIQTMINQVKEQRKLELKKLSTWKTIKGGKNTTKLSEEMNK